MSTLADLFIFDSLSLVMIGLIGFVGLCVAFFSSRYLKGDRNQRGFYINLFQLVSSVFIFVTANNIWLFLTAWAYCSWKLTRLMLHKSEWKAAEASSFLALKSFMLGFVFLISGLAVLFFETGENTVSGIISSEISHSVLLVSGILILLGAMVQSAIWPFHNWLTSSLNSPTPASAVMHAGLINGGGFILARFGPLYLQESVLLNIVFAVGIVTALLGTLWQLMQSDVKRMLANSTMGQMGFMFVQCGLGLFPAAIAHLCWHGLFKAYLFLSSGSAAKEKRLDREKAPSVKSFLLALVCGFGGALAFGFASNKSIHAGDTTLFLMAIALIAGTQMALPLVRRNSIKKLPVFAALTMVTGMIYGMSIKLVENALLPLNISMPLELNSLHVTALVLLAVCWLGIVFFRRTGKPGEYPLWILKFYVGMLNASQPHPKTVTANRNKYKN